MRGFLKGARDLYGNGWKTEDNLAIHEKYTRVPVDAIREAREVFTDPNGEINLADLERQQRFLVETGQLAYRTPLDLATMVDRTFLDKALARLGRVEVRR